MARLQRVHQKVFASNATNNGVFGSLQAGNPTTSNDVATLQSLPAFENGWEDSIEQGDKLPPLEEFQGVQYGISYQQAYMLQEGIAEWNASTPYYKGSLAKTISGTSFKLYCSLADDNTGNAVSDTTKWQLVMDSDAPYAIVNANNTFTGNNTFTKGVYTQRASTVRYDIDLTDTSGNHFTTVFWGSDLQAKDLGREYYHWQSGNLDHSISATYNVGGVSAIAEISARVTNTGEAYCWCTPTGVAYDNTNPGNRVVTAKWLVDKFQVVNDLPISPVPGVFYFIKE